MNFDLFALVGKMVRRITFSLLTKGNFHLVYSVIEEVLPDMQDYDPKDSPDDFICKLAKRSHRKNPHDKIFFSIDWFVMTEEFLRNPVNNYILNDKTQTKIFCDGKYQLTPANSNNVWVENDFRESDLFKCFPRRSDSRFINVWGDVSGVMRSTIMNDKDFSAQYSQVSSDWYGVDLSDFPEFIGNINIIRYNPYFREIGFSVSVNPPGIYATLSQRGTQGSLHVDFVNKNNDDMFEYSVARSLDLSKRYHFWALPDTPERLSIYVTDDDENLVFAASDIAFIRQISMNTGVLSKHVKLQHRDGSSEWIDKFSSENFTIGSPSQNDIALNSPTEAFRLLEKSLDFAFFNGSKDTEEKEQNKKHAQTFVKKILDKASSRCMIADPYFNLDDLSHYVFTMKNSGVPVKVLSAKEYLSSSYDAPKNEAEHKGEAKAIADSIKAYAATTGDTVQFKLLTGKCSLHDRYIVADDSVWLLGTSFNEIGSRACTIIKLPQASCRAIINTLEDWWHNKSISAEDYAAQP